MIKVHVAVSLSIGDDADPNLEVARASRSPRCKDLHPAGKLYVTSNKEAKATDPNHRWCLAFDLF
jgi:hypothetical protein